jgi:hypothetical protein
VLYTATDYITYNLQKENEDIINEQGYFELSMHTETTKPLFIKIGKVKGQIYVQPDFVYGITIPPLEDYSDRRNDTELEVNIGVVGTDSTELNALIFDYQEQYNALFLAGDGRFLSRAMMFKLADSLKKLCEKRYSGINNSYFKSYVDYSIASINANLSRGHGFLVREYILGKAILYDHHEYMHFFNSCFRGYLNSIAAQRKGETMYQIVNVKVSYEKLHDFLVKDKLLKGDSLIELVVIQNLWDLYYSAGYSSDAIKGILGQMNEKSRISANKRIMESMLIQFNNMQAGSKAPSFSARTANGTIGTLAVFKGRWVYLNFFSTENITSLKELPKMAALHKKYGDKVTFLSVCLDDSLVAYHRFLKENPKYDWPIWFNNEKSLTTTAKQNYFLTGTEGYFLISNEGYLIQSPALAPSQGIEYKFNILFKPKRRTTKTGIR